MVDAARLIQRHQQRTTIAARSSTTPKRIGDRLDASGNHQVLYPAGGIGTNGIKDYNAAHESGDTPMAIERSDGAVVFEGRSVRPATATTNPNPLAPCKTYRQGRIYNCDHAMPVEVVWEFHQANGASWTQDDVPAADGAVRLRRGGTIDVRIAYQDAANSGGSNDTIQTGLAVGRFNSGKAIRVSAALNGVIEQQGAGFELLRILAGAEDFEFTQPLEGEPGQVTLGNPDKLRELYSRSSIGRGLGTQMEEIEDELTQQTLNPGEVLLIYSSTIDSLWHVGAGWQVSLVFEL
jgi:hypothetical protein